MVGSTSPFPRALTDHQAGANPAEWFTMSAQSFPEPFANLSPDIS
jgi:hypothetical protein